MPSADCVYKGPAEVKTPGASGEAMKQSIKEAMKQSINAYAYFFARHFNSDAWDKHEYWELSQLFSLPVACFH